MTSRSTRSPAAGAPSTWGSLLFLLLATVALVGVPWAPARAGAGEDVSRHLTALRTQAAIVDAACAPIEQLASWRLPDRDRLAPLGRRLLDATISFQKVAAGFVGSRTRRGLREELDIVSRSCRRLSRAGQILRQVSAVKLPGVPLTGWEKALDTSVRLAHTWMMIEVTQELVAKGPRALLEARSFGDIQTAAWKRMEQAVQKFRGRIDRKMRKLNRYLAPLELLEAEGLAGFVQIKARQEVQRLAAALVVNISPSGLVVRIAGDIIYRLATEVLWPKLREVFRQKGNLDARVARSLETLEKSRLELNKLGAGGDSSQVPLDDVRTVVARAQGRLVAMRFLVRDISHAQRDELLASMAAGATHLRRAISLTEKRFLLDRVEEIKTLETRVALLGPLARGIQRLLRALEDPNPVAGRGFFVQHGNMIASEKISSRGGERPSQSPTPPLFAHLTEVNLAKREQAFQRHVDAGRDPAEFSESSTVFAKSYNPPHLLMATCEGQTRYLYRHKGRRGTMMTYGSGKACGLSDGPHRVALTVYTIEGFELYFEYTIVVKRGRRAQRAQLQLERSEEALKRAWERYSASGNDEERQKGMRSLAGGEAKLAALLYEAGAPPGKRVPELLASALTHLEQGETKINPRAAVYGHLFRTCREYGDAACRELYAKAWTRVAPHLPENPRDRARTEIDREVGLAHLAISSQGDIAGARKHLENAIKAQEAGGLHTTRPDWKENWYDNFPEPLDGSAHRDRGPFAR